MLYGALTFGMTLPRCASLEDPGKGHPGVPVQTGAVQAGVSAPLSSSEQFRRNDAVDDPRRTSQSVRMAAAHSLRPTPWRTCRAIANRTRLEMFGLLVRQPGLTVSAAAKELKQPLSVTSEYLRALEARGLLVSRRVGGHVEYRVNSAGGGHPASRLAVKLRLAFQRNSQPVDTIFKIATAFTHPRRIEIFRVLKGGPKTLGELRLSTRISRRAARRHLEKLERRGFVVCRDGDYTVVGRFDSLRLEFARLATE